MPQRLVGETGKSPSCGPLLSHCADPPLPPRSTPTSRTEQPLSSLLGAPCVCSVVPLPRVPQVPLRSRISVTREAARGGRSVGPRASVDTDPTSGYLHPSVLESAGISPCSYFFLAKHQLDHRERRAEALSGLPPPAPRLAPASLLRVVEAPGHLPPSPILRRDRLPAEVLRTRLLGAPKTLPALGMEPGAPGPLRAVVPQHPDLLCSLPSDPPPTPRAARSGSSGAALGNPTRSKFGSHGVGDPELH